MPSKREYDLVCDDIVDGIATIQTNDALQLGINFQAKYIGTVDVPRPSSRIEIVAAMRRIRFEFKAQSIKKQKVILTVSAEGVKVKLAKKNKLSCSVTTNDDGRQILMDNPVCRIFYVSHDSQDLKIFSYIARDASNLFKCSVFKAFKKKEATQVVRTIGQAFEICHRLSVQRAIVNEDGNDGDSEKSSCEPEHRTTTTLSVSTLEKVPLQSTPSDADNYSANIPSPEVVITQSRQLIQAFPFPSLDVSVGNSLLTASSGDLPSIVNHRIQLLHHQLELQTHQTQYAMTQVHLLQAQLAAETSARIEAQTRTDELLRQNQGIVDQVNVLVTRLVQLETPAGQTVNYDLMRPILQNSTPESMTWPPSHDQPLSKNKDFPTAQPVHESPDSGHRDMSSDSLSFQTLPSETWYTPRVATHSIRYTPDYIDMTSASQSSRSNNLISATHDSVVAPRLDPPPKVVRSTSRSSALLSSSVTERKVGEDKCPESSNDA